MNFNDNSGVDSVVTEIHIAAPPERVFRALTDQGELMRWFTDSSHPIHRWEMDARPGGSYRYFTDPKTAAAHGASAFVCYGEILEFDPPRLLVYTWIADCHADKSRRTVVRWELTEDAAGTKVKVTHSGLVQEAAAREDYSGGWLGMVKMLKSFLEERVKSKP